jgi:hypothetical protein
MRNRSLHRKFSVTQSQYQLGYLEIFLNKTCNCQIFGKFIKLKLFSNKIENGGKIAELGRETILNQKL